MSGPKTAAAHNAPLTGATVEFGGRTVRVFDPATEIAALRDQRDELRAAVAGLLTIFDNDDEMPHDSRLAKARSILAKVKP